ncbi:MAG: hypothetical protein WDN27_01720 [Candidatus Saccharibacteria bacterium]
MQRIRLFITGFAVLLGLGAGALAPAVVLAGTPTQDVCATLGSDGTCTTQPAGGVDLNKVVTAIINILSIVVGITAVIMVILGGFRFITAAGDSNNIASARRTILYAVIGLAIVAVAQALVQFVLNRLK